MVELHRSRRWRASTDRLAQFNADTTLRLAISLGVKGELQRRVPWIHECSANSDELQIAKTWPEKRRRYWDDRTGPGHSGPRALTWLSARSLTNSS
jgi:hypothetical protein